MVVKGWSFVKCLCGCRYCRGRSPQNPQTEDVELVGAVPPDLPPHNDTPGQLATIPHPQPAPIADTSQQPLMEREEALKNLTI
ncbi:hypothetical protein DAPPUDRAFT_322781 [Daphnia pulex]|uniref:Uncharacterized protein n=1 Tax=Daphnia pulex TaxID=6669 RepID=E9GWY8_DAPPU|nr:hypothetical protein DAPPUDRAFT_322781 [Daphnia pulex]|eukprot:EFX75981.1 hypothetical protein DAPPUDRAFT_322781 [Daphnia pulex]